MRVGRWRPWPARQHDSLADSNGVIHYTARTLDPYSDGVVDVRLGFRSGRVHAYIDSIPGFTVRPVEMGVDGAPVTLDTVAQIQGHLIAHQYEGLIKKSKLRGGKRGR